MIRLALVALLLLASCSRPERPLEVYGRVPEFQLTSQTGDTFSSAASLQGHIWVADFIFTNCAGPCPRMTSQMKQVQNGAPGIKLVSFTVDPERDTPLVLSEYAKRHQADTTRWTFLTGPMADLHKLKREVFLLGNVDGQLNHSTRFVLVDTRSQIRGFYDTSEPGTIKTLIRDIERLQKES